MSQHAQDWLSMPDPLQQLVFAMLHPKQIYAALPAVCRWWQHLLLNESFLHSLCSQMQLSAQQIPSPLTLDSLTAFIARSCVRCAHHATTGNALWESKELIGWQSQICRLCFD